MTTRIHVGLVLGAIALGPLVAQGQEAPEGGVLDSPAEFWLDPRFDDPDFLSGAPRGARDRVFVWFERQLLPSGDSYADETTRLADAPRRALRDRVVERLRSLSERSWEAAADTVRRLEREGVVADCEPRWIVNGFACERRGDPRELERVPGARMVFRTYPAPPPRPRRVRGSRFVEPDPVPFSTPATVPWQLEALRVPEVWSEFGLTGRGVLSVVHDFGFRLDLAYVSQTLLVRAGEVPGNGIDDDGNGRIDDVHGFDFDAGDDLVSMSTAAAGDIVHGNSVAGIIAGRAVGDSAVQLGVAPDSRWAPVMGLARFEEAVEWAILEGADTYTMSFSLDGLGDLAAHWRKVFEHAAMAGLFAVSGAGNFADSTRSSYRPIPRQMGVPEGIPEAVLGVSGLDSERRRPHFSSQGPVRWEVVHYDSAMVEKPELATVNRYVVGTDVEGRETTLLNGNSFAGPHLAGILALMLEADPDLTPWRARAILIETARDVEAPGFDDQTGHGQVDALAAVRRVLERPRPTPRGGSGVGSPFRPVRSMSDFLRGPH